MAEVKRHIGVIAPGGGFIFDTMQNIQASVTLENLVAAFDTALRYSRATV